MDIVLQTYNLSTYTRVRPSGQPGQQKMVQGWSVLNSELFFKKTRKLIIVIKNNKFT